MNNQEFVQVVAELRRLSATTIKPTVEQLITLGQKHVYNKTSNYWIRRGDTISVSAGTKNIDLAYELEDYKQIRMLWTTNGFLDLWGEEKFHRTYPDDTATASYPTIYITKEEATVQIYPVPSSTITLYANYFYMPDFKTITSMPEEWQHVVLYYVMAHYENPDESFYKALFRDSLNDFIARAKPSPAQDADFIPEDIQVTISAEHSLKER